MIPATSGLLPLEENRGFFPPAGGVEEAAQLLKRIEQEKVRVFYVVMPAEYGVLNGA